MFNTSNEITLPFVYHLRRRPYRICPWTCVRFGKHTESERGWMDGKALDPIKVLQQDQQQQRVQTCRSYNRVKKSHLNFSNSLDTNLQLLNCIHKGRTKEGRMLVSWAITWSIILCSVQLIELSKDLPRTRKLALNC